MLSFGNVLGRNSKKELDGSDGVCRGKPNEFQIQHISPNYILQSLVRDYSFIILSNVTEWNTTLTTEQLQFEMTMMNALKYAAGVLWYSHSQQLTLILFKSVVVNVFVYYSLICKYILQTVSIQVIVTYFRGNSFVKAQILIITVQKEKEKRDGLTTASCRHFSVLTASCLNVRM